MLDIGKLKLRKKYENRKYVYTHAHTQETRKCEPTMREHHPASCVVANRHTPPSTPPILGVK